MGKTRMLFTCIGNACRSQMAEGFARKYGGDRVEIFSAGSNPAKAIALNTLAVMHEIDIDLSRQKPKGFADLPITTFDYVISLHKNMLCPIYPTKERIYWDIMDPISRPIGTFRKTRDEIGKKVEEFLAKTLNA